MPPIFSISNEDKLVEEKANFFHDWFHYYTTNVGYTLQLELENPLSLVDKAIYQLENNSEKYIYNYLKNYFSHEYFNSDPFLAGFGTYAPVKNKIDSFKKIVKSSEYSKWTANNGDFLQLLKKLSNDLKENMFESALSEILSYLKCSHKVDEHVNRIKLCVKIFVTEYILRGRSREDLRAVFHGILSRDILLFPFPSHVKTQKEKEEFMEKRGLDEQFGGLANLIKKEPYSWTFYLKIYGAELGNKISFTYDKVTFYGKHHNRFKKARKEGLSFFKDRSKFFVASIKVYFFSQKVAIEEARIGIKKELTHVSLKLNRDLIVDSTLNYLTSDDGVKFLEGWSTEKQYSNTNNGIIKELEATPFYFLREYSNDAKIHLLNFEHLLLNAIKQNAMHDYWHYLETILQLGNDESKVEKIVETVAAVLVTEEKELCKRIFFQTLVSTFHVFNFPFKKTNFSDEDVRRFRTSFLAMELPKEVRNLNYPFVKELIKDYRATKGAKYHKMTFKFYCSVLKEAYEQRNFYQHQATSNKKSIIKLQYTFPWMVQRFRWAIFDEIKKHNNISFNELIEILVKRGHKASK